MGAEGHVLERGEVAGKGLDVAAVLRILETGFHDLEQVDGVFEDLVVMGGLEQFAEPVDGESLGVQLLLGLQPLAGGIHAPVHAMDGRHQVFRLV